MSTVPLKKFNMPEEYLEFENASPYKHQYYDGQIFPMTGLSTVQDGEPSLQHNIINGNISGSFYWQLRGKVCEVLSCQQRIKIPSMDVFTYPDSLVVCGVKLDEFDPYSIVNPTVIIEVFSPLSERFDRGKKFGFYRELESLAEYVLVAEYKPHIERHVRRDDGAWICTVAEGMDASISLDSIQCRLSLADVYDGVKFDPPSVPH